MIWKSSHVACTSPCSCCICAPPDLQISVHFWTSIHMAVATLFPCEDAMMPKSSVRLHENLCLRHERQKTSSKSKGVTSWHHSKTSLPWGRFGRSRCVWSQSPLYLSSIVAHILRIIHGFLSVNIVSTALRHWCCVLIMYSIEHSSYVDVHQVSMGFWAYFWMVKRIFKFSAEISSDPVERQPLVNRDSSPLAEGPPSAFH